MKSNLPFGAKFAALFSAVSLTFSLPSVSNAQVGQQVDVAVFLTQIDAVLQANFGYAIQIRQGGQPVYSSQGGWAIRPAVDTGGIGVAWTQDTRIHIASVSKIFSAHKSIYFAYLEK